MEAITKCSHVARRFGEHSFEKGEILTILEFQEDGYNLADYNGRIAIVDSENVEVKPADWFAGNFTYEETVAILNQEKFNDGHFLVRYSASSMDNKFVLSFRYGKMIINVRIRRHENDGSYYLTNCYQTFHTVNQLIDFYREKPVPETNGEVVLKDVYQRPKRYAFFRIEKRPVLALVSTAIDHCLISFRLIRQLKVPYNPEGRSLHDPNILEPSTKIGCENVRLKETPRDSYRFKWNFIEFRVVRMDDEDELVIQNGQQP